MTALVDFGIREQAGQRFEQLGWPTPRLEEWKYTNLAPVQRATWKYADSVLDATPMNLAGAAAELVFVNGIYAPALSTPNDAFTMTDVVREKHYARYADYENHAMTALNTANAQDCAMLQIDRSFDGFIHLHFIATDGYESHPRNLIVVKSGVQA